MAKKREGARIQRGALSAEEAERLFATVDETGHTNEETAARQRRHRKDTGQAVDVDPLSDADPSGSNVEKVITRTAVSFVIIFLLAVTISQVSCGVARRITTANLSEHASVSSVASALRGGVEWGNGFTQFPEDFSVQEADENTHRIEVTVVDTASEKAIEAFAGAQIQSSAFAVNALLNPNVNTVIYRVNVHVDDAGNYQTASLFGFLKPKGELKTLMTFVWTKTTTENGVRFNCTITGVDEDMQEQLRENITSSFTPTAFLGSLLPESDSSSSAADDEDEAEDEPADGADAEATDDASAADADAADDTTTDAASSDAASK